MFGSVIREARERVGLTQNDLALLINTSHYRISTWEREVEGIGLERTGALANALRLPPAKLVAGVLQYRLDNAQIDYTVAVRSQKVDEVNTGATLKQMRLAKGTPLRELARQLLVAPPRVVAIERGDKLLKPETAWWYAEALGIDPKEPVRIALQEAVQRHCGSGYKVVIN
jgi:transcriptional regulator with XRE-family HTH domain